MVRLSDQVPVAFWVVRLEFAYSSLKRTLSRTNILVSLELRLQHARLELADSSLKRTLISSEKKLRISKPFFPNTPILIFPHSKHVPNNVYRSYTWKHTQWCTKLKIKTSFYQNLIIHQTFINIQQQQLSSSIHQ